MEHSETSANFPAAWGRLSDSLRRVGIFACAIGKLAWFGSCSVGTIGIQIVRDIFEFKVVKV